MFIDFAVDKQMHNIGVFRQLVIVSLILIFGALSLNNYYVGHTGVLINPHAWRGRCQAGYSNTGGPPLPRKRAPFKKKLCSTLLC